MNKPQHQARKESTTTLSVRINKKMHDRLETVATGARRSKSFLAGEAISEYLAVQEWQIAGIKQAIASVKRYGTVPSSEVEDWVKSWGTKKELPMPRPRKT